MKVKGRSFYCCNLARGFLVQLFTTNLIHSTAVLWIGVGCLPSTCNCLADSLPIYTHGFRQPILCNTSYIVMKDFGGSQFPPEKNQRIRCVIMISQKVLFGGTIQFSIIPLDPNSSHYKTLLGKNLDVNLPALSAIEWTDIANKRGPFIATPMLSYKQ